ncbi:MAG: hypothetical protein KC503_11700 [Myxococcales bacterium]|nr:hypothetical protein [Myxococcales bacterium]
MIFKRLAYLSSAIAATGLLLWACGGGDEAVTRAIGAAGGSVQNGSAKVVVPAGALSKDTNIAIAVVGSGYPAMPAGASRISDIYALTPHGTTFNAPATVTIPLRSAATAATLWKAEAGSTQWHKVSGATVQAGSITASVSSFSFFAVTSGEDSPSDPPSSLPSSNPTSQPAP